MASTIPSCHFDSRVFTIGPRNGAISHQLSALSLWHDLAGVGVAEQVSWARFAVVTEQSGQVGQVDAAAVVEVGVGVVVLVTLARAACADEVGQVSDVDVAVSVEVAVTLRSRRRSCRSARAASLPSRLSMEPQ
jgi:hypothetical protein